MRVLIGPTEVAGLVEGLTAGFREIGMDAEAVLESQHPFGYRSGASSVACIRWWSSTGTVARRTGWTHPLRKLLAAGAHLALSWVIMLWSLRRFDAFVFTFGKTLTNSAIELFLLRWLKRPVVMIFVGSDARPPYINGAMPGENTARLARDAARLQRRIARFERYGVRCINAPGTSHFHARPVVNWFAIGFPRCSSRPAPQAPLSTPPRPLRLLHSPSKPNVKGTPHILAAVNALAQQGLDIELITLTGRSNAEVQAELAACDLVLDQLYSDTPMAGLVTEAAWLGRPSLVAGYFAQGMPDRLLQAPVPPSVFVHPDDFASTLEALIRQPSRLRALGAQAFEFVEQHWRADRVAQRIARLFKEEPPQEWLFDPTQVVYLQGCGLTEDEARSRTRRLIMHHGLSSLRLLHRPDLAKRFAEWAGVLSD